MALVEIEVPGLEHHLASTDLFLTRFCSDLDEFLIPLFETTISEICASNKVVKENVGLPWIASQGLENPYTAAGADGVSINAKQVDAAREFREAVMTQMVEAGVRFSCISHHEAGGTLPRAYRSTDASDLPD